ncbi:hypothetical protein ABIB60_002499 [Hymenobacter sp. UYP22]
MPPRLLSPGPSIIMLGATPSFVGYAWHVPTATPCTGCCAGTFRSPVNTRLIGLLVALLAQLQAMHYMLGGFIWKRNS